MDWSRAKTILIVAFLITNLFLASAIYKDRLIRDPIDSKELIDQVEELLAEKDISFKGELNLKTSSLIPLVVEYEKQDLEDLNRRFFQSKASLKSLDPTREELVYGSRSLIVENNKKLEYRDRSRELVYKDLSKDRAQEIAYDFIESKGLVGQGMELTSIHKNSDDFIIIYSKKYKGIYLEKSYIRAMVNETGLVELDRVWLDIVDKGEKPISPTRPEKAILSLLSYEEAYGKTIEDISICYYFNPEEHEYIENTQNAKRGKTVAAWRVRFTNGQVIFIDNY